MQAVRYPQAEGKMSPEVGTIYQVRRYSLSTCLFLPDDTGSCLFLNASELSVCEGFCF